MIARVNGEERLRGQLAHAPLLGRHRGSAARNTELHAGEILASGTVGTGCILEHGDGRYFPARDVVELEVEGIGVLRNRVGLGPHQPSTSLRV